MFFGQKGRFAQNNIGAPSMEWSEIFDGRLLLGFISGQY